MYVSPRTGFKGFLTPLYQVVSMNASESGGYVDEAVGDDVRRFDMPPTQIKPDNGYEALEGVIVRRHRK